MLAIPLVTHSLVCFHFRFSSRQPIGTRDVGHVLELKSRLQNRRRNDSCLNPAKIGSKQQENFGDYRHCRRSQRRQDDGNPQKRETNPTSCLKFRHISAYTREVRTNSLVTLLPLPPPPTPIPIPSSSSIPIATTQVPPTIAAVSSIWSSSLPLVGGLGFALSFCFV